MTENLDAQYPFLFSSSPIVSPSQSYFNDFEDPFAFNSVAHENVNPPGFPFTPIISTPYQVRRGSVSSNMSSPSRRVTLQLENLYKSSPLSPKQSQTIEFEKPALSAISINVGAAEDSASLAESYRSRTSATSLLNSLQARIKHLTIDDTPNKSDYSTNTETTFSYENSTAFLSNSNNPTQSSANMIDSSFLSSPVMSSPSSPWFSPYPDTQYVPPQNTLLSHLNSREFLVVDPLIHGFGVGNCLFEALADQMYGDMSKHVELRQKIAAEISSNWKYYVVDIHANYYATEYSTIDLENLESSKKECLDMVDEYVQKISQTGEIGDAICVAAFSNIFKCDVLIYLVDQQNRFSCFVIECERSRKECNDGSDCENCSDVKHIGWYRSESGLETGNHYVSIYPSSWSK
ncbi:hypothetical protein HK098_002341 [Nowakowskiella sp. JEL0407]|nr:hypothetical protein HK098_002341 [Nowakowskiella sp. JEL0407]